MATHRETIALHTQGNTDVLDLTGALREAVKESGIREGLATVMVTGSTAGVTTIEFEPGLVKDLKEAAEKWVSAAARDCDPGHGRAVSAALI